MSPGPKSTVFALTPTLAGREGEPKRACGPRTRRSLTCG
ncbi:MAG: hypothetical protein AVDCRST_MAG64-229 [uncultured Phycisphaerae bacterium]|uniref:Uncharacterized protein n=1 Tax=uncultured Phycisphaerae bacterium TaxID=904963 RepID=A0A6J4N5P0_9BACT|nr:MAG: hypothetical protein AVDCRST_MAG64-229 [uncultured Phycisphaerae bacterium]